MEDDRHLNGRENLGLQDHEGPMHEKEGKRTILPPPLHLVLPVPLSLSPLKACPAAGYRSRAALNLLLVDRLF